MYKVTKMGLLNFWYYDEEEYEFYDGKLLLRGENASGKSVTMQSFIPLILDGNKSPKRLDTFGGSDKHIEYYLLGDDKEASIGYLYMEFYNKTEDKYVTIGIGLSAKKGKQTDFWGFALKDGSRINDGFVLYKIKDGFNKSPLTKNELKASLGLNNEFVEKAKDYKRMVNNLLFGFKNIEDYDDFINIILQIRSPKLSKDFKPSILVNTLNNVLPPLSDDDLRPLSETIESLNGTKEKIEELGIKIKDLSNFIKVYNNYNEIILYGKTKKYIDKKNEYDNLIREEKRVTEEIVKLQNSKDKLSEELNDLKQNYELAKTEKENINNKDVVAKTEKLAKLEIDGKDLEKKVQEYKIKLDSCEEKIRELNKTLEKFNEDIYKLEKDLTGNISDLEELSDTIYFESLKNYLDLLANDKEIDINMLFNMIKTRKKEIEEIKNYLEEKKHLDELIETETRKEEELTKEYNKLVIDLEKLEDEMDLLKDEFITNILVNNKKHQVLVLSDDNLKEITKCLTDFNLKTVEAAKDKWNLFFKNFYEAKMEEKATLSAKLLIFQEELKKEEENLEKIKNTKETELSESVLEIESLEYLNNNDINYLSFYKAIEFKDNIAKEVCDKLEANMLASGLLNAKIINKNDLNKLNKTNISYIIPSKKKKDNLTKYLQVSEDINNFSKDYIKDILESISISNMDEIYLNENNYHFDFLNGKMSNYESKYIGFLNRQKEQLRKLKMAEEKVLNIKSKINSVNNLIDNLTSKINNLLEEQKDFPSIINLENKTKDLERIQIELDVKLKNKNDVITNINKLNDKLQELLINLNKLKGDSKIPLNLGSYNNALITINAIINKMYELDSLLKNKKSSKELIISNNNYLEDIKENYDSLFGEITISKEKIKRIENDKKAILEILNTKEYQELQEKLKKIETILITYDAKNDALIKNIGSMEKELEGLEAKLIDTKKEISDNSLKLDIYFDILKEELELKYIISDFELTRDNAKNILKRLENSETRDKENALANYYKGFNNYRQSLMDYAITDNVIFSENDANIKLFENKGLDKEELKEIYNERIRRDISAIYQNKKVNLYTLLNNIKNDYEENKIYLSESDRHLFEDILLRTVGTKIKDKINNAKEWVNNINKIMEEKQKNSNLAFHLLWQSLSPESLEEMDTKELVEIFKMDPDTLTKETINKLIKHFRAKIAKAEETMNDNKESYFDIIFNILDYRNWFQFKLFYRRNNGDKKELTDKMFSVFSGGEKAKTMYVPLFASVSAKLSSASSLAPRLIALDEAFAGVDDKNIEEMFAILKSFDLDYILTSQALWCDYSEIKDISICNLVSDHISKTIAVNRYRWNGIVRIPLDGE